MSARVPRTFPGALVSIGSAAAGPSLGGGEKILSAIRSTSSFVSGSSFGAYLLASLRATRSNRVGKFDNVRT